MARRRIAPTAGPTGGSARGGHGADVLLHGSEFGSDGFAPFLTFQQVRQVQQIVAGDKNPRPSLGAFVDRCWLWLTKSLDINFMGDRSKIRELAT